jgi:hypothetical protein
MSKVDKDFITSRKFANFVAHEYKKRIDKAIDYITTEQLYTNYQWGKSQYQKILKDLLNILKGDDKDEN